MFVLKTLQVALYFQPTICGPPDNVLWPPKGTIGPGLETPGLTQSFFEFIFLVMTPGHCESKCIKTRGTIQNMFDCEKYPSSNIGLNLFKILLFVLMNMKL